MPIPRTQRGGWPYSQPPNVPFVLNKGSPQAKGLVAWWPTLASRGANVLRDLAGRGINGTFPGGANNPSWVTNSGMGSALLFDRSNDQYVNLDGSASLSITGELTHVAWIYPTVLTAVASNVILTKRDEADGGTRGPQLDIRNTGKLSWGFNDGAWQEWKTTNVVLSINTLFCVVVTYREADAVVIYVNGVPKPTNVLLPPAMVTNPSPYLLGIYRNAGVPIANRGFDGSIGDTRIYNRALSAAEVWQQYVNPWELYHPLIRRLFARSPVGGIAYFQAAAGAFTPAATLVRQPQKNALAGAFTPAGVLVREPQKVLSGTFTSAGVLVREPQKVLAGILTSAGVLVRAMQLVLVGTLTSAGVTTKETQKPMVGAITPTGTLTEMIGLSLSGVLTLAGALVRQTGKVLSGVIAPTATLTSPSFPILARASRLLRVAITGAPLRGGN